MKVKEISRTANVAWSPSSVQCVSLACGTVAQQLDATFSTSAKLEIFSLDLGSPGLNMPLLGAVNSPHRFHKLTWSGQGSEGDESLGQIIGGSDNGIITIWSASKVASSSPDALLHQTTQHVGAVRTLDVNPFQSNLLVSGAGESEIFIWDLNNLTTPMSPGNKIHPLEDISGVAWNRQVQHIMASTSPSGRSVVWDLRKNEPIIQVTDSSSRVRCNGIAWHPDVATQMVTASGDDRAPIIQMWDLRFATAPMRILEHHKRGVLSLAWCQQDSDLLLSAAKDNQVFCWNPNTDLPGGEVVYELPGTSQWIFECHWCPRNPSIISTASFDGHVTLYSLLGGGGGACESVESQPALQANSDDVFAGLASSARAQGSAVEACPLKKPPKWLRRPCGANFSFGGSLVSFGDSLDSKAVTVKQVVTEHDLVQRSHDLEESLSKQQFVEFCESKSQESSSERDKNLWNFMKVTFDPDPRRQYLRLLGYDTDELAKKFSTWTKMSGVPTLQTAGGLDINELSKKLSSIPVLQEETSADFEESEASSTAAVYGSEVGDVSSSTDPTLLSSDPSVRTSVRVSNASFSQGTVTPPPSSVTPPFSIPLSSDTDGMLAKALLVGNFEAAVDICISADMMVEALILAVAGGSDLYRRTQLVYFQKNQSKVSNLLSSVVQRNWEELTRCASLDNWREVLAALVTYTGPDEFSPLCDLLGERLEKEMDGSHRDNAALCYICSGNVDKFVECWITTCPSQVSGLALQDLMEKVVILRRAVKRERGQCSIQSDTLNSMLHQYSSLLASQGSLATALRYLQESGVVEDSNAVLYDRVYKAQRSNSKPIANFPFSPVDVLPPQPSSTTIQQATTIQRAGLYGDNTGQAVVDSDSYGKSAFAQPTSPTGLTGFGGNTGLTGSTSFGGNTGPTGSTGFGGNTGSTGFGGNTGLTGSTSFGGNTGPTGSTGFGGNTSLTGSTSFGGNTGPTGSTGFGANTGPTGSTGFGGNTGLTGSTGFGGNTGPTSSTGFGGNTGPTSSTGFNANTGQTGSTGFGGQPPGPQPVFKPVQPVPISTTSNHPLPTKPEPNPYNTDTDSSWNDPPLLKPKKPLTPVSATGIAPITAPVQPLPQQPLHPDPPTPKDHQPLVQPHEPSSPVPAVQMPPIPQEHLPMITAFEAMLERCKPAATNSNAVRRKLDDIYKKLSILCDLLRSRELSPDVLQGLHYMAQDTQNMNYPSALMRYTHMVSAGNFSEISSFMPGIKALLQLGTQLRV